MELNNSGKFNNTSYNLNNTYNSINYSKIKNSFLIQSPSKKNKNSSNKENEVSYNYYRENRTPSEYNKNSKRAVE